ncbi:hypothetical protein V2G26_006539 [Clonostachys chloroleuca]
MVGGGSWSFVRSDGPRHALWAGCLLGQLIQDVFPAPSMARICLLSFLHCLLSARPAASLNLMLCNIVKPAINKNTKHMWLRCVWTQLLYSHVCLLARLPSE